MNNEMDLFVRKQLKGISLFGLNYQNRVKKFAEKFSEGTEFDREILDYSVSLHNVSARTLLLYGKEFHSASASVAERFLKNTQLKQEKISVICECIRNAGVNGIPSSFEGKILQNAVLAEFLGKTGIAYFLFLAGIKRLSSLKLMDSFNGFMQEVNSVHLLGSSEEEINKRKEFFESFFNGLFEEFD
ncbi:MAG: hypothetical protein ABIA76_03110 [Candidatus Diapherotrites archaeon]